VSEEKKKYKIDMSKERWWTEEEIRQAAVEDLAGCALGGAPGENHAQAREQRGTTHAA